MRVSYARVATQDLNLELQRHALTNAKCEPILEDKQSGANADTPGLVDAVASMRSGRPDGPRTGQVRLRDQLQPSAYRAQASSPHYKRSAPS
ncbi:MAG: recombinase family protein [Armatimonadetes bacterium]|nr:recombinase family protein [Armatimonadota bacterium]MDE2207395.1 recombinase family protein [Armatimonadota bacterium]